MLKTVRVYLFSYINRLYTIQSTNIMILLQQNNKYLIYANTITLQIRSNNSHTPRTITLNHQHTTPNHRFIIIALQKNCFPQTNTKPNQTLR